MAQDNIPNIKTCVECKSTSSSHWVLKGTTCKKCYMKRYNHSEAGKYSHKKYLKASHGKTKHQEWIDSNKPKVLIYKKKYRSSKKCKVSRDKSNRSDSYRICKKKWNSRNRGLINSLAAKRRATKLKATPIWANLDLINSIYKKCPKGYHVDHIIPLQGKNVCGLHVEYNLQYLTAFDNVSKGNKL